MNKIDINEELLKREMLKMVKITQNAVIINCEICRSILFGDNGYEVLRKMGLPSRDFCGRMNEELIRYIYFKLMKSKIE